jgi:hypothetical protein
MEWRLSRLTRLFPQVVVLSVVTYPVLNAEKWRSMLGCKGNHVAVKVLAADAELVAQDAGRVRPQLLLL